MDTVKIELTLQSHDGKELPTAYQIVKALADLGICCGTIRTTCLDTGDTDQAYVLNNMVSREITRRK